jgi:phage gp29-like protein
MTDLLDKMSQPFGRSQQSRPARREGANRSAGSYEGMQMVVRPSRPFAIGDRSAHFDTLFGHYIDVVHDPSRAKQRDPDVHNRMRQDLQILGCLNVRKLATIQLRREWTPANETPEAKMVACKFEKWFEQQYRPSETLSNFLDAMLDGISIQEAVWTLNEDDYSFGIKRMFPTYKDRFVFSKDGQLAMKTRHNLFYGELVHPWQFIKHVYNVSGGGFNSPMDEGRLYWGQGLEDHIYPNYFFKTVVLNLYTRWLQRLSAGVLVARYPERNPEGKAIAIELLEAYQEDEELAFPSGDEWDVDIKEATRAPADTYLAFIEYIDRQISKAILGSTLIIDQGDVGSQSLGEVHERTTFGRVSEFDRVGLVETINTELVPPMGKLNHIPKQLWPKFNMPLDETSPASNQILEAFTILQGLGFDVSAEMISEKTGFRRPKPGETLLSVPMSSLMGEGPGGMEQAAGPGGPLTGFDVSKPEGMEKMRQLVYRSGRNGRDKLQVYKLGVGGVLSPHNHEAKLDSGGNGETSKAPDGHRHEIRAYRCVPTDGHSHEVLVSNSDIDRVIRLIAS